jgi:cell division protein FtsZ
LSEQLIAANTPTTEILFIRLTLKIRRLMSTLFEMNINDTDEQTVAIIGVGKSVQALLKRFLRGEINHSEKIVAVAAGLSPKKHFTLLQDNRAGARQIRDNSEEALREVLEGTDLILLISCMSDGDEDMLCSVGNAAKETGALVVAIVAMPLIFEGKMRGTERMERAVDAIVPIDEGTLLSTRIDSENPPFSAMDNAFFLIIGAFIDIAFTPGIVNLDVADLKNTLAGVGLASVGVGTGVGAGKFANAATMALAMMGGIKGARRIILNVTGGIDVGLTGIEAIATKIYEFCHEDADFVWGHVFDPEMKDSVNVTIIACVWHKYLIK